MRVVARIAPVSSIIRNQLPMSHSDYASRRDEQSRTRRTRQRLSIALAGVSFSVLATADVSAIRNETNEVIRAILYLYVLSAAVSLFACLIGAAFTYSVEPARRRPFGSLTEPLSAQIGDLRAYCIRESEHDARAQICLLVAALIGILIAIALMLLSIFADEFVEELPQTRAWLHLILVAAGCSNSAWFIGSGIWYLKSRQKPRLRRAIKADLIRVVAG